MRVEFFFRHFYSALSFLLSSPSLWGTVRYRLKYCLKWPLSQKQTNNRTSQLCKSVLRESYSTVMCVFGLTRRRCMPFMGMDGFFAIFILFNSISVISGRWAVDNERLCTMELSLRLRRFHLERGSNSVR